METRSRTRIRLRQLIERRDADLQRIAELEQDNQRLREEIARWHKARMKLVEDYLVSTEQLQCSLKFVMEQSVQWVFRLGENLQQSSSEKG